jgi:molybdopterin adenylyltransferase
VTEAPRIAILTVSDRVSRGEYEDRGGPAVRAALDRAIAGPWEPVTAGVPDEFDQICAALIALADDGGCSLVVTTGGTGPAERDVTPEATRAVCGRELPGFGEAMRAASLRGVPTAMLSRQTAGLRGRTLIVNVPGSPRGAVECLDVVLPAAVHCIALIGGPRLELADGAGHPHD